MGEMAELYDYWDDNMGEEDDIIDSKQLIQMLADKICYIKEV